MKNTTILETLWLASLVVVALCVSAPLQAATLLLQDDFNDNSIDGSKWSVVTSGIPQNPKSVVEQNQQIELQGRGHLNTVVQFEPTTQPGQGLRITGQWTFVNSDDMMQILTRSDGTPDPGNCCGETANGVEFRVQGTGIGNTMTISGRGGASITGVHNSGALGASAGETYDFEIRETGTNLYFTMDQVGGTNKRTVVATSPTDLSTDLITFHNREGGRRSNLDNVVIDSPSPLGPAETWKFPILLQDNFDDNSLDAAKWTAVTSGIPGPASVSESNSRLQLDNRGYLVSADQFDPADGGLRLEGRWTFGSDDFLQVLTRSDATPDPGNCCGETLNGIEFYGFVNDNMQIRSRIGGTTTTLGSGSIDIDPGDVFDFLITDDGNALTFELTELGGDGSYGMLTANSTQVFADNYLVFHNRETSRTSFLDDVVVSQLQAVPEPTTLLIWSLLAGLGVGLGWRRRK